MRRSIEISRSPLEICSFFLSFLFLPLNISHLLPVLCHLIRTTQILVHRSEFFVFFFVFFFVLVWLPGCLSPSCQTVDTTFFSFNLSPRLSTSCFKFNDERLRDYMSEISGFSFTCAPLESFSLPSYRMRFEPASATMMESEAKKSAFRTCTVCLTRPILRRPIQKPRIEARLVRPLCVVCIYLAYQNAVSKTKSKKFRASA